MESADVEACAQLLSRARAQFAELQLPKFVGECLRRPGDVAIRLRLDGRLINRPGLAKEVHYLISRPAFGVDAGIDDEAYRAEELTGESSVVAHRILVEANLFAGLLGVQRPTLDVARVLSVTAKLWQARQLLRDRELHVMAGYAFVICDGFVIDERALRKVGHSDDHAAGAFAVRRAGLVVRGVRRLKSRHSLNGDRRAGNEAEKIRELWLHLRDVLAKVIDDLLRGGRLVLGVGLE